MKILFYIHGITGGGGERVLATLANEFVGRGEDVSIATDINSSFAYSIDENIHLHDMYEGTRQYNGWLSRIRNSILLRKNIRSIAKRERPDVIVAFMSSLGCSVIMSTLGLGVPVIVSEHTNVSRKLGMVLNIKRDILYPFAACVTVLTRYDRRLWGKKYHNVVYMPNPISLKGPDNNIVKEKIVLAVGRVNQWEIKGFDNLLRCWAMICHSYPDWTLKIAGAADGKSTAYLNNLAHELDCCNYEFLGFRKDIYELLSTSEVFCLSSRVEGLPMALIEAMSARCCCVSFDVMTGPREIIQNGKSGLIAENQKNEELVSCLEKVLGNAVLRNQLAGNAPLSIKKYSLDSVMDRWYILFNKILKR